MDPLYSSGYLTYVAPIDATALKIPSKKLNLSDIAILEDRIFALDDTQGIFSFKYNGNIPVNIQYIDLKDLGISKAFSLDVIHDGNYIQMLVASENELYNFQLETISSTPQLLNTYLLLSSINTRIITESNANYIYAKIGRYLNIYNKHERNHNLVKHVFTDV